jgi:hypothetical protein
VSLECVDQCRLDFHSCHPIALGVVVHKGADQRLDIFRTFPERGDSNGHDVETIEEVFPEPSCPSVGGEVAVGCGDQTSVDDFRTSAHLLHLTGLEGSQDLGLDGKRQLADLIDEESGLVRLLEIAKTCGLGTGEGAFGVSKQFGLGELAWDSCCIGKGR